MRRIFKTQEAESDLEGIWLYSFEEWNEEQVDKYYDQLIEAINKLLDNKRKQLQHLAFEAVCRPQ